MHPENKSNPQDNDSSTDLHPFDEMQFSMLVNRGDDQIAPKPDKFGVIHYYSEDEILHPIKGEPRWKVLNSTHTPDLDIYYVFDYEWQIPLVMQSQIIKRRDGESTSIINKRKLLDELHFEKKARTWIDIGGHENIVSGFYTGRLGGTIRFFTEYIDCENLQDYSISLWASYTGKKPVYSITQSDKQKYTQPQILQLHQEKYKKIREVYEIPENPNFSKLLEYTLDMLIQLCNGMTYIHHRNLLHSHLRTDQLDVDIDGILKISNLDNLTPFNPKTKPAPSLVAIAGLNVVREDDNLIYLEDFFKFVANRRGIDISDKTSTRTYRNKTRIKKGKSDKTTSIRNLEGNKKNTRLADGFMQLDETPTTSPSSMLTEITPADAILDFADFGKSSTTTANQTTIPEAKDETSLYRGKHNIFKGQVSKDSTKIINSNDSHFEQTLNLLSPSSYNDTFFAPEQGFDNAELTIAIDIYSFALIFYEMLTGVHPLCISEEVKDEFYEWLLLQMDEKTLLVDNDLTRLVKKYQNKKISVVEMKILDRETTKYLHRNILPIPPHTLNPNVPRKLSLLVMRLLRKSPADRKLHGSEKAANFLTIKNFLARQYAEIVGKFYTRELSKRFQTTPEAESNRALSYLTMGELQPDYDEILELLEPNNGEGNGLAGLNGLNLKKKILSENSVISPKDICLEDKNWFNEKFNEIIENQLNQKSINIFPWVVSAIMSFINPANSISNVGQPVEVFQDFKKIYGKENKNVILQNKALREFTKKLAKYRFRGHKGEIKTIAISPSGNILASGSTDRKIILWSISTGKIIKILNGHKKAVTCLTFLKSDFELASGSIDGNIFLWDTNSGKIVKTYEKEYAINGLKYIKNNKTIIAALNSSRIEILSLTSKLPQNILEAHKGKIFDIAVSDDESFAVSVGGKPFGSEGELLIWDLKKFKLVKHIEAHGGEIRAVEISKCGRFIVTGSADKTVKIWDAKIYDHIRTLAEHSHEVFSIAISSNKRYIFSASWDKTIKIYDFQTGELLRTINAHKSGIHQIALAKDDNTLFSAADESGIKRWVLKPNIDHWQMPIAKIGVIKGRIQIENEISKLIQEFNTNVSEVLNNCEVKDESKLSEKIDNSLENKSMLFSKLYADARKLMEIKGFRRYYKLLSTFADVGNFIGTRKALGNIWLHKILYCSDEPVSCIEFSPGSCFIGTATKADKTIFLWSIQTGDKVLEFSDHDFDINSFSFSLGGRFLSVGCSEVLEGNFGVGNQLVLWHVDSSTIFKEFPGYKDLIFYVCFSPDGKYLISIYGDKKIKIWDINTGAAIKEFVGDSLSPNSVAFSPDSEKIATIARDKIKIWSIQTGELLWTLEGHTGWIVSLMFTPDGKFLVSTSQDNTIRFWMVSTGKRFRTIKLQDDFENTITLSPCGNFAVYFTDKKQLKIWSLIEDVCVWEMEESTDKILSLRFSSDGRYLAAGTDKGMVKIWEIDWEWGFSEISHDQNQEIKRVFALIKENAKLFENRTERKSMTYTIEKNLVQKVKSETKFVTSLDFCKQLVWLGIDSEVVLPKLKIVKKEYFSMKQLEVVSLFGNVNNKTANDLNEFLKPYLEKNNKVKFLIFELSELYFISDKGSYLIEFIQNFEKLHNGVVKLANLNPKILRDFEKLGVSDYFSIEPTLEEALAELIRNRIQLNN